MSNEPDQKLKIPLETFLSMQFNDIKKSIDGLSDEIKELVEKKADKVELAAHKAEMDKVKSTQRMLLIGYAVAYGALFAMQFFKDKIFN